MEKGIKNGIKLINDISGLKHDKDSVKIVKKYNIPFVIHHMQGNPDTMQNNPTYNDVLLDIFDFFESKINFCNKQNYNKLDNRLPKFNKYPKKNK